jgi:hypothetical protein
MITLACKRGKESLAIVTGPMSDIPWTNASSMEQGWMLPKLPGGKRAGYCGIANLQRVRFVPETLGKKSPIVKKP